MTTIEHVENEALALALKYHQAGNLNKARNFYEKSLKQQPNLPIALVYLGFILHKQGNSTKGLSLIEQGVSAQPHNSDFLYNKAVVEEEMGSYQAAIDTYHQVIADNPHDSESLYGICASLQKLGDFEQALVYANKALMIQPQHFEYLYAAGNCYSQLGSEQRAVEYYQRAAMIKPTFEIYNNLATIFSKQHHYQQAIDYFQKALQLSPNESSVANNYLLALMQGGYDSEAKDIFPRAIKQFPHENKILANYGRFCELINDWSHRQAYQDKRRAIVEKELAQGSSLSVTPFHLFTLPWPDELKLKITQCWANKSAQEVEYLNSSCQFNFQRAQHHRLRIGYLSANFRDHATGHSVQRLFEYHDKNQFEVYGYSYGIDDGSVYRQRIMAGCDHFIDLYDKNIEQSARQIYEDEIDILIDFSGHSLDNRLGIFALKPAPIQISYHVFAASTGADYMDYFIGDNVVSPLTEQHLYTEKLINLPHCYRLFDDQEVIPTDTTSRKDYGLPDDAFVYCSFNNSYKIEPEIFATWMTILKQTDHTVLWLMLDKPLQKDHLLMMASRHDVDPHRIIFATRQARELHMARQIHADLCLDTCQVSAHTTGTDILWAGLPILSCPGDTFVGRVTASLLQAANLPELIVDNLEQYCQQAIDYANHPEKLARIKDKLLAQHQTAPLFNVRQTVRDLEARYLKVWDLYLNQSMGA